MGDSFFVCHHLAAIYAYTYVLVSLFVVPTLCKPGLEHNYTMLSYHVVYLVLFQTRGVLPYFANFRLISELSTPFVNQRLVFPTY